MSRSEAFQSGDEWFERSAGNGAARVSPSLPTRNRKSAESLWSPAFRLRVDDAIMRIKKSESLDEIRAIHGMIVVRQAVHELLPPKGRVVY